MNFILVFLFAKLRFPQIKIKKKSISAKFIKKMSIKTNLYLSFPKINCGDPCHFTLRF